MIGEVAGGVFYGPQLNFTDLKRPRTCRTGCFPERDSGIRDQSITPSRMFSSFTLAPVPADVLDESLTIPEAVMAEWLTDRAEQ